MKTNNDYDVLTLYADVAKKDEVIEHYKVFQWDMVKETENEKFEDVVDLTFQRPHKVENKDELQLLQVYMEDNLNSTARLTSNKYKVSTIFEVTLGVLGLLCVTFGLLFCFDVLHGWGIVGGTILASIGVLFGICIAIFVPIMVKRERKRFNERSKQKAEELEVLFERVRLLTGGRHE